MHGKRKTKQRDAIISTLEQAQRPLSLDDILSSAREDCPGLGQRTVFRNLAEMIKENLLIRVNFPGQPVRYELPNPDGGHHPHFICRECNQVFVLPGETPEVLDKIEQPPEFQFEGEEVVVFGRCVKKLCPLKAEKDLTS
ncbi:MAG: Fur family transcriptional regulator [Puniceicoccales bacterium]